MSDFRICKLCKENRPITDFGKNLSYKDKIDKDCKVCNRIKCKNWRENNKEKHRNGLWKCDIWRKYRVTPGFLLEYIKKIYGLCEICGKIMTPYHIDHNHNSGEFRGLLCPQCNVMIGMANENGEILGAAIGYLRTKSLL